MQKHPFIEFIPYRIVGIMLIPLLGWLYAWLPHSSLLYCQCGTDCAGGIIREGNLSGEAEKWYLSTGK